VHTTNFFFLARQLHPHSKIEGTTMIPTLTAAGQWAVVPLAGVHMDFETWVASFKFEKVSFRLNFINVLDAQCP
jgi:predicted alternative tryptophan synthase beta-subunit